MGIQSRMTTEDGNIVLAGANPSAEDGGDDGGSCESTMPDVLRNHELFKVGDGSSISQKDFKKVWMVYLKKLIAKLKDHDEAKLTEFKANFIKIPKSDWQSCVDIYVPDGCFFDGESMLILSKYTGEAPEFYYLKYGLDYEKC